MLSQEEIRQLEARRYRLEAELQQATEDWRLAEAEAHQTGYEAVFGLIAAGLVVVTVAAFVQGVFWGVFALLAASGILVGMLMFNDIVVLLTGHEPRVDLNSRRQRIEQLSRQLEITRRELQAGRNPSADASQEKVKI